MAIVGDWRCAACKTVYRQHVAWCSNCGIAGWVTTRGDRPRAAIDGLAEIATARSLVTREWATVEVKAYPSIRIAPGALVIVHGGEGSGKSTLLVRMLDSIAGVVLLLAAEEKVGPTIAERLVRCRATRETLLIMGKASVDQLATFAFEQRAVAIGIDSVNVASFTAADLRHLMAVLPHLRVLFGVAQHTKADEILGPRALLHEADTTIRCEAMKWRVEKSRYQESPTEFQPVLDLPSYSNDNAEPVDAKNIRSRPMLVLLRPPDDVPKT